MFCLGSRWGRLVRFGVMKPTIQGFLNGQKILSSVPLIRVEFGLQDLPEKSVHICVFAQIVWMVRDAPRSDSPTIIYGMNLDPFVGKEDLDLDLFVFRPQGRFQDVGVSGDDLEAEFPTFDGRARQETCEPHRGGDVFQKEINSWLGFSLE